MPYTAPSIEVTITVSFCVMLGAYRLSFLFYVCAYGLCLNVSAKPHMVTGGAFSEGAESRVCDAGIEGVGLLH